MCYQITTTPLSVGGSDAIQGVSSGSEWLCDTKRAFSPGYDTKVPMNVSHCTQLQIQYISWVVSKRYIGYYTCYTITLFRSITVLCGTDNISHSDIFCGILSGPHNVVMDLNNVMTKTSLTDWNETRSSS